MKLSVISHVSEMRVKFWSNLSLTLLLLMFLLLTTFLYIMYNSFIFLHTDEYRPMGRFDTTGIKFRLYTQ